MINHEIPGIPPKNAGPAFHGDMGIYVNLPQD